MSGAIPFPRLSLGQLANEVTVATSKSLKTSGMKKVSSDEPLPKIPIIPPRLTPVVTTLAKNSDDQSWYVVLSPREVRGLSGPFSITQLKQMYKSHDIYDSTLVWREGEQQWQQLVHQSLLRSQLINLPILPPRVGSYNAELAIFDPVAPLPESQLLELAVPLPQHTTDKYCAVCGSIAVAHIPGHKEQKADLSKGRSEVGATEFATEVLPGFLWIGSSAASKHKSLLNLGITLLINCTDNMKNPAEQPPYFRCKDIPLREKPSQSLSEHEERSLLHALEMSFDWIELERTMSARNRQGDPLPDPHAATDVFGLPIKDKPFHRPDFMQQTTSPEFPPRVMIWSRLGTDRCMIITIAYMIKHFGMNLKRALKILKRNRPAMNVSGPYQLVLEKWSKRYALGMLLCLDCKTLPLAKRKLNNVTNNNENTENTLLLQAYQETKTLLGQHIPRVIKDSREVNALKEVDHYLLPISLNGFRRGPMSFSGLLDLNLMDRRLSDVTMAFLIQLLTGTKVILQLRSMNFRNNQIHFLAMKELLMAFFTRDADPDDNNSQYYVDDAKAATLLEGNKHPHHSKGELTALDLSHNHIEPQGAKYLSLFLKQCHSLIHLDLFHNDMSDECCADIISCLMTPMFDFQSANRAGNRDSFLHGNSSGHDDDDEDFLDSQSLDAMHNRSVTYLDIGGNRIGKFAIDSLTQMLKQNGILSTLRLTHLRQQLTPLACKEISNAIRLYNGALMALDLSGTTLSVNSAKHIARIHDSLDTHITKMILAQCSLTHLHMAAMAPYLAASKQLTSLDISGNPIGSKGAEAVATVIRGTTSRTVVLAPLGEEHEQQQHAKQRHQQPQQEKQRVPPLKHLDLTFCELDPAGCAVIMQAIAGRQDLTLSYVDFSYNAIGRNNNAFVNAMKNASVISLQLNYCHMHTSMATLILQAVTYVRQSLSVSKVTSTLRSLGLAGNEISDSVAESLTFMLKQNYILEYLDLGFNLLTNHCMEFFQDALKVNSESEVERKVFELSVNLVGNKCLSYGLDTPGLTRSKVTFRFGTQPNIEDEDPEQYGGYGHVENRVRGKFLAQKAIDDNYHASYPFQQINQLK